MTSSMRQNYCILTTDGSTEFWSPITRTIFWQEDEWAKMSNTVWMPKECCLAIDNCYFEGLTEEKDAQLRTLFSTKQIVQKFSVSGLYQSLRTLSLIHILVTRSSLSIQMEVSLTSGTLPVNQMANDLK